MTQTSKIEEIASKHLGRTSDGGTMTRYETPDAIDASLLTPIPRYLNRTAYGIDNETFAGFDTWNAYEVSFLLDNGYPVSGVVKCMYHNTSESIVESKSIKLYLNSYNMAKMGSSMESAIRRAEENISKDLTECVGDDVEVKFFRMDSQVLGQDYNMLEDLVVLEDMVFDAYAEDPDILEVMSSTSPDWDDDCTFYTTNALRSNCRVTNQPDWGDIYIYIKGENTITPESMLKYIVSMRTENHFHEEICECVTKRLMDLLPDHDIAVACLYTRRGGIDINPVRGSCEGAIDAAGFMSLEDIFLPHRKTERQ